MLLAKPLRKPSSYPISKEHPRNLDSFSWYGVLLHITSPMTVSHTKSKQKQGEFSDNQVLNQTKSNEKQQGDQHVQKKDSTYPNLFTGIRNSSILLTSVF